MTLHRQWKLHHCIVVTADGPNSLKVNDKSAMVQLSQGPMFSLYRIFRV